MIKRFYQPFVVLSTLFALAYFAPTNSIDPWKLFSPKKILSMIFALAFVQSIGSILKTYLGARVGSILGGFLGGLVSSTATTATLAKSSQTSSAINSQALTYLAATLAMLFEASVILVTGAQDFHPKLLIICIVPALATTIMLALVPKTSQGKNTDVGTNNIDLLAILKLSIFILSILTLSKLSQIYFGHGGIILLTGLVSLFEIHGSVIANVQLHDSGAFDLPRLGNLLSISIAASYISKLFLIYTIGSKTLFKRATLFTGILFIALVVGWSLFKTFS